MLEVRAVTLEIKTAREVSEVKQLTLSYYTLGGSGKLTIYPEALLPCTNKRLRQLLKCFKGGWETEEVYQDFITELIDTCLCLQEDYDQTTREIQFDIDDLNEKGHKVTSSTINELVKIAKRKAYLEKNYKFLLERRERNDYR